MNEQAQKVGNEELKEALVSLLEISLVVAELLKDGAQLSDLGILWQKFFQDPKFKEKIELGFEGMKKVPAEVKDLDLAESMELVMLLVPYLNKFVGVIKNEPK